MSLMMMKTNPITPPPELFAQCYEEAERNLQVPFSLKFAMSHAIRTAYAAGHAAGADQELEACCKWLAVESIEASQDLRTTRRPKPPSLKEQALAELGDAYDEDKIDDTAYDTIRRALEALND
jgi:hypothetical protein